MLLRKTAPFVRLASRSHSFARRRFSSLALYFTGTFDTRRRSILAHEHDCRSCSVSGHSTIQTWQFVWGLEKTLKLFYGDTKLSQMDTATAVYAFDVDLRNPVLFVYNTSQPEPHSDAILIQSQDTFFIPDRARSFQTHIRRSRDERYLEARRQDFYIRDLGRASSALPAVHAAKRFTAVNNKTAQYDCIDGGLVAPNPTLNSLMFMLSMNTISEVDRIATLSLGTGAVVGDYALNADSPWRWLTSLDLFRVVIDCGSKVPQTNLYDMFYDQLHVRDKQFLRIQPLTNDTSNYAEALNSITDVSQLDMLKTIGELVARDYTDDLDDFIEEFIFGTEEKDPEMKKA